MRPTRAEQPLLSAMSGTQSHQSDSPYPRENFWGEAVDEDRDTGHDTVMEGPPKGYQYDLAAWKAHHILKDTARKLCGESWLQNREIELTPPCLYPPDDPVASQRHAVRYNPERGYISGGESTWVKLDDRPRAEFMEIVETCIELWKQECGLSKPECDALREKARTMKGQQNTSDEDVLRVLILAIVSPTTVVDYFS